MVQLQTFTESDYLLKKTGLIMILSILSSFKSKIVIASNWNMKRRGGRGRGAQPAQPVKSIPQDPREQQRGRAKLPSISELDPAVTHAVKNLQLHTIKQVRQADLQYLSSYI